MKKILKPAIPAVIAVILTALLCSCSGTGTVTDLLTGTAPTIESATSDSSVSGTPSITQDVTSHITTTNETEPSTPETTPETHSVLVTLPYDISITVNGLEYEKTEPLNGFCTYEIPDEGARTIVLRDAFGSEQPYDGQLPDITYSTFDVEIPENFVLTANTGVVYPAAAASRAPDPDEAELRRYLPDVKLRDLLTYRISAFTGRVTVEITDDRGQKEERDLTAGCTLSIRRQRGSAEMPEKLRAEVDPMNFALAWSKFMTNDLSFKEICSYFPEDSAVYREARTWATGPDHKLTSQHEIKGFGNKQVGEFVQYSENCFSVRASLTKSLYLPKGALRRVEDKFDMTVYFVRYDATPDNGKDDPKWTVAVKHGPIEDLIYNVETEGIEIIRIEENAFKGTLMIVKDPSRVSLATIRKADGSWPEKGITLDKIAGRFEALAAINGGLYSSSENTGGYPLGVVVSNGVIVRNKPREWKSLMLVGLDGQGRLHIVDVSEMTAALSEKMIEEKGIRDAVCFQELTSADKNHFVQIINDGVVRDTSSLGSRNPRTVIGQREDGALLLLVTDGRGYNCHTGATASEVTDIMARYGAVNAANLDGGSSTCMYYDGAYLQPSVTFYYSTSSWRLPFAFVVK